MNELFFLRKSMREKRNSVTKNFREKSEKNILENFKKIKNIQRFTHIAAYMAFDGEVNVKNIIEWCWRENKKIFLPKLNSENNSTNNLIFLEYSSSTKLEKNKFGIDEPVGSSEMPVENLDLILLPLTAFDRQGNRLGMGQGYYDATLHGLQQTPLLVGVGFGFQGVEQVPSHERDVRLDAVVTEDGLRVLS